jgi:hypothetical protein
MRLAEVNLNVNLMAVKEFVTLEVFLLLQETRIQMWSS